jgi:hypothetical protein
MNLLGLGSFYPLHLEVLTIGVTPHLEIEAVILFCRFGITMQFQVEIFMNSGNFRLEDLCRNRPKGDPMKAT